MKKENKTRIIINIICIISIVLIIFIGIFINTKKPILQNDTIEFTKDIGDVRISGDIPIQNFLLQSTQRVV